MNINEKTTFECWINCEEGKEGIKIVDNQAIKKKIHITKDKSEILKTMLICFKKGGVNGMENKSLNELLEIIDDTFSFDYKGNDGVKATKKESILRSLKQCEQNMNE